MDRIRDPKMLEALRAASIADKATRDSMSRGFANRMDRLAEENADMIRRYEEGPTGDTARDLETAKQSVWIQIQAIVEGRVEFARRQHHLRNADDTVRGMVPEVPDPAAPVGTPEAFAQALRIERSGASSHWFAAGTFLAVPLEPTNPRAWFRHAGRLVYRPGLEDREVREAITLTPEWWAVLQDGDPRLLKMPVSDAVFEFTDFEVELTAQAEEAMSEEVNR